MLSKTICEVPECENELTGGLDTFGDGVCQSHHLAGYADCDWLCDKYTLHKEGVCLECTGETGVSFVTGTLFDFDYSGDGGVEDE